MTEILSLAGSNLASPIILSFALGLAAALARSDLSIPEAVAKGMSIYLLFAIGFKGGASVAAHGVDGTLLKALAAGIVLSFGLPFIAFALLKTLTGMSRLAAAAGEMLGCTAGQVTGLLTAALQLLPDGQIVITSATALPPAAHADRILRIEGGAVSSG